MKVRKFMFARWFSKTPLGSGTAENKILDPTTFNRMLCLERKRSHRTGNPFVLLVIDVVGLPERSKDKIPGICTALQAATRDTDLCGWYRDSSEIGIIFTALQDLDRGAIEAAISAKTSRALRLVVNPEEFSRITMSAHFFPEQSKLRDDVKSDKTLYPDLIDAGISKSIYHGFKRAVDIVGSLALLILLSPLCTLISILIKCSSDGPVLFKQNRVGRFGREFQCLKFRTMYTNSDHGLHRHYVQNLIQKPDDSQKVYKIVNDPRVTPVGRFLRKTSLDEVPQFINVLLGDMSLVGPRPPIPYEISCYRPWHRRRVIETKPGITGLWQVYGRSRTTFDEMVRLDIRYIEEQSLWLDLKVLFLTPWAVITCLGAY